MCCTLSAVGPPDVENPAPPFRPPNPSLKSPQSISSSSNAYEPGTAGEPCQVSMDSLGDVVYALRGSEGRHGCDFDGWVDVGDDEENMHGVQRTCQREPPDSELGKHTWTEFRSTQNFGVLAVWQNMLPSPISCLAHVRTVSTHAQAHRLCSSPTAKTPSEHTSYNLPHLINCISTPPARETGSTLLLSCEAAALPL